MSNNIILVSSNKDDLPEMAREFSQNNGVQGILLTGQFTREVNFVSAQTSKKNAELITQSVVDANRGDRTLETTGFTSKEDAYIDIAVALRETADEVAQAYARTHDINSIRLNYSPRTHTPRTMNTMSYASVGFLNASAVFKGETLNLSHYCEPRPESGDVFIAKAFDSRDQGNNKDDLIEFSYNAQKRSATSVGLSVAAFKC